MQATTTKEKRPYVLEFCLIVIAILVALPIYYLLVTTLKTPEEAAASPLGLPHQWILSNYVDAWKLMHYPRVFMNNFIITFFSLIGCTILPCMASYGFARSRNWLSKLLFLAIIAGLVVPFQIALIPLYKLIMSMHLMNTLWAVVIINVSVTIPFNVFLFINFVKSLPLEVEESASIDGSGVVGTFFRIVLPLMQPVIASAAILNSLTFWNDFMGPLLFLQTREKAVILQEVYRNIGQFSTNWTAFFPMMVLGVAPLLLFYIIMQKYIISGIAAGSVKG
ncbi:raffinose/stachyose/melibiose transport system permease protein [Paenibacillus shirakamiensis]|uniref:Raffinose/stachyose/melibiose transport system permease protein n=1 Tax=Paenibacillus shirakamiensis TaxID=1265935 RepID=A0ABS4JEN8_9BACL|nr:carbohydrate ABC transporter permease [Paenibacillus shirakamiensis]MBP2000160.1 raffinose/stachyose/melibiose transport system permease protein [Paenibacillus shirakamiensis]